MSMDLVKSSYINEALLYVSLNISWEIYSCVTYIFDFFSVTSCDHQLKTSKPACTKVRILVMTIIKVIYGDTNITVMMGKFLES